MSLILNQAQAEAVYSAMCALDKVGSIFGDVRIQADRAQQDIRVQWDEGGPTVGRGLRPAVERYADQAAFAAAYGLDGKEPRTAVYTAGIGWQVATASGRRGNFDTEAQALAADPKALIQTL